MKVLLSVVLGLLLAWVILSYVDVETYVMAPVVYDRSNILDPSEEERRVIQAIAASSGQQISDAQANRILEKVDTTRAPAPLISLPGAPPPAAFALPQPGAEAPRGMSADTQAARAAAADAAAAAAGGPGGGGGFGGPGGGMGSVGATTLISGGIPLLAGAQPTQPITAVAGVLGGAPAPAPAMYGARGPAPAPKARRRRRPGRAPAPAPAPAARRGKTRRELILEDIDKIMKKI